MIQKSRGIRSGWKLKQSSTPTMVGTSLSAQTAKEPANGNERTDVDVVSNHVYTIRDNIDRNILHFMETC
jgi:hypothetical protein